MGVQDAEDVESHDENGRRTGATPPQTRPFWQTRRA